MWFQKTGQPREGDVVTADRLHMYYTQRDTQTMCMAHAREHTLYSPPVHTLHTYHGRTHACMHAPLTHTDPDKHAYTCAQAHIIFTPPTLVYASHVVHTPHAHCAHTIHQTHARDTRTHCAHAVYMCTHHTHTHIHECVLYTHHTQCITCSHAGTIQTPHTFCIYAHHTTCKYSHHTTCKYTDIYLFTRTNCVGAHTPTYMVHTCVCRIMCTPQHMLHACVHPTWVGTLPTEAQHPRQPHAHQRSHGACPCEALQLPELAGARPAHAGLPGARSPEPHRRRQTSPRHTRLQKPGEPRLPLTVPRQRPAPAFLILALQRDTPWLPIHAFCRGPIRLSLILGQLSADCREFISERFFSVIPEQFLLRAAISMKPLEDFIYF